MKYPSPTKNSGIQIIRAIAVVLVLFQHLSISAFVFKSFPAAGSLPFWLGVELFFIVSGVVISDSLMKYHLIKFVYLRILRLFPAYLFMVILSALLAFTATKNALIDIQVPNLFDGTAHFIRENASVFGFSFVNQSQPLYQNSALWSLDIEWRFYLFSAIYVFLAAFILKNTVKRFQVEKLWFYTAVTILATCTYARIAPESVLSNISIVAFLLQFRIDFFFLGVVIWHIRNHLENGRFLFLEKSGLLRVSIAWLLTVGLVLASISAEVSASGEFLSKMTIFIELLFGLAVLNATQRSPVESKLHKTLMWIGDRSYGIYLLHFTIFGYVWVFLYKLGYFKDATEFTYSIYQLTLSLPLILITSNLCFKYIELPMQHKLRKLF